MAGRTRPALHPGRLRYASLEYLVRVTLVAICASFMLMGSVLAQPEGRPAFRSGVDLVSVSAVVTDRRGRLVTDLSREDFLVLDGGEPRSILDFWAHDAAAVSVALLIDASGSMRVGSKMTDARATAHQLLSWLRDDDEAAVFAFDTQLRELRPFGTSPGGLPDGLVDLEPYGATSLYDAIAETAHLSAARETPHRAVVVISDGLDTNSALTAPEVSAIASAIDVPVYLVAVVSPLDHPESPTASAGNADRVGRLRDLVRWTGGGVYFAAAPSDASVAVAGLLREFRHQYVLAFEASTEPGWRLINVSVEDRWVRTRSAYQARRQPAAPSEIGGGSAR